MIHPRPGPIGLNSINTIEAIARTSSVMERVLVTAVGILDSLSPHLRIRDERKNQDSKKRKRSKSLILQNPIDPNVLPSVSDITGIKGKYKLSGPDSYKIEVLTNPSKQAILGPIANPVKSQQNIIKMLQFVDAGRNIDLLA